MNAIQIYINKTLVDKPEDSDIGLRLQRFLEDDYELTQRGGDYSLTLDLPITKTNERIFGNKTQYFQYRKFGETTDFPARIELNGTVVFEGVYRLSSVTRKGYRGEFAGIEIDWLSTLDSIKLRELGYVDGEPTWLVPFSGMNDANSYNQSFDQDIVFPDISYNNVPITDYLAYGYSDIFGTNPKDLPYEFPTFTAHWRSRYGSTFEDFPPAVKYEAVLRQIFAEIGYDVKGDIFKQEWFKRLILPYTGSGYIWNWQTLAKLRCSLVADNLYTLSPNFSTLREEDQGVISKFYRSTRRNYYEARNCLQDSAGVRTDNIANFKKFGVTDYTNGYVVPEDGIYKIDISSNYTSLLQHTTGDSFYLDDIDSGVANTGYDDNVLVIMRENQYGEYVLNQDVLTDLANFLTDGSTEFISEPNDVIAYIIPKRVPYVGTFPSTRWAYGSPLTNWQSVPTWTNTGHSFAVPSPPSNHSSQSGVNDFSVTLRLLKNERVHAYWFSVDQVFDSSSPKVLSITTDTNNVLTPYFEIEYLCGTEDIDVARNLPDISAKDFLTSFIRLFNLSYTVDIATRSINFGYNKLRDRNKVDTIDITEYIDEDSIELRPIKQPKRLTIGYNNDDNDRLLTAVSTNCTEETRELVEYGNTILVNDSIYADGEKDIRLPFSATKFIDGYFNVINKDVTSVSLYSTFNKPNGNPFYQGLVFTPANVSTISYKVPSIQSEDSFDQDRVGDLTYSWDYKPRLLYYIGTYATDRHFLVGSPSDTVDDNNFWKHPTICSFDGENLSFTPDYLPSLRYNNYLYSTWFENQLQVWKDSHVFKADIQMNPRLWNKLDGTQRVVYNNDVYRLLTIEDYDVSGDNLASITLLKLT